MVGAWLCSVCPLWRELTPIDDGYVDGVNKGKCLLCPPRPVGEYHLNLSAWTLTLGTDTCAMCKCRGCAGGQPPVEDFFLLKEDGDYILQESGDKLIQE